MNRIFISIASYRDVECQHTVHDLFAKAKHPERIRVGICWQLDMKEDHDCFVVPSPFPAHMRIKSYHWSSSKGGCWARAQALSLLEDEEYVLQIDAHMRFEPGWDEIMIEMLARCPGKNAALSTIVPGYAPPHQLRIDPGMVSVARVFALGGVGDLQPVCLSGWLWAIKDMPPGLKVTPFFVGNFMFAPARLVREIPFDPHIYFRGQEAVYSARLWTHGWDIYQPDRPVIYHFWQSVTRKSPEAKDYKAANDEALLSRQRVWHMLGLEAATNPAALVEIEKYGMGAERSLEDFWGFSGVNLKTGVIEEKAQRGLWTPYSA